MQVAGITFSLIDKYLFRGMKLLGEAKTNKKNM